EAHAGSSSMAIGAEASLPPETVRHDAAAPAAPTTTGARPLAASGARRRQSFTPAADAVPADAARGRIGPGRADGLRRPVADGAGPLRAACALRVGVSVLGDARRDPTHGHPSLRCAR